MKKIIMFTMQSCPYCQKTRAWMEQLLEENPAYQALPLQIIDEVEQSDIADTYDYYYVPTFFVNGKKVHEGAASMEIVRKVFDTALEP